jgi:CRP-like cAMP-binding protein
LSAGTPFFDQLIQTFQQKGKLKTFKKGEFILKEGEVERNLYWIEEGAVRVLLLTEFEEHTVRLGYKNGIINSLSSYIKEQPSEFYIEVLRKTIVRMISKNDIEELINKSGDNLLGYTKMLEGLVTQTIDREIDLLIASPTERLNRVLKRSPNVFQEVPLKYIASYLRMTPETLSRLRNS